MKTYDLIIIGGGRASNLAVTAASLGKKVALIEKTSLGGTCPNRGCVPSKLLIGYAHVARAVKESSRHFIDATIENIDVQKIFDKTNAYVGSIDSRYESRMDGVDVYRGVGSFVENKVIDVNGEKLTATNIVIATGTRPIEVPHEKAWSSDTIFPFEKEIPKSITVVGSGFIAVELANFFDAVGIKTTLIARSNHLLSNEDKEISEIFKEEFIKNVKVLFKTTVERISHEHNEFTLNLISNDEKTTHKSEALLYATGRVSNADLLGLQNTDIEVNERGFIKRDENFQTKVEGVYVVGDASGNHMLQHAAAFEVNHLGKMLYKEEKEPHQFKYMPHAVFTDPEVASVGKTQEQLEEQGITYVSTTTDWLASAKAMSLRIKYPRTKLLIDPNSYEILGAHMIGPESATMMHQVLAIMHLDNDIRHLKEMLYIHPALSEALLPAAVNAVKKVEEYNAVK